MVATPLNAIRVDAFKMARSGDFANAEAIVAELQRRGYVRVRLALQDPIIRSHIDQLCIQNSKDIEQPLSAGPE